MVSNRPPLTRDQTPGRKGSARASGGGGVHSQPSRSSKQAQIRPNAPAITTSDSSDTKNSLLQSRAGVPRASDGLAVGADAPKG
eukprot:scaffold21509_cov134-Isochrysis_galbana.AAC.3